MVSILCLLLEVEYKTKRRFFIKKRGPFSLWCMRVYWDLLPRMVYFIINKSKKKESSLGFFYKKKKGGGVVLLKNTRGDSKANLLSHI